MGVSRDSNPGRLIRSLTLYPLCHHAPHVERNAVVKFIRKKKKEYYKNMIDSNKEDPTKM